MTDLEKDQRIAELEAEVSDERKNSAWEAEQNQQSKEKLLGVISCSNNAAKRRGAEIERMRTALKGISNQRFQGNPSSDRLHNCIGIARVALSGAPAPQPDPKDATIERLRTALEKLKAEIRLRAPHESHCEAIKRTNVPMSMCSCWLSHFGDSLLPDAALSGTPVAPAPPCDECDAYGVEICSKHQSQHDAIMQGEVERLIGIIRAQDKILEDNGLENIVSVGAPVAPAPCPDCDTGFPEGRLCLTCKGTCVVAPAPEPPAPTTCKGCNGTRKRSINHRYNKAGECVEYDEISCPLCCGSAPTKEKL